MVKQEGIILINFIPGHQRLYVFDSQMGKIDTFILNNQRIDRLRAGMLIQYDIKSFKLRHYLENADIIKVPIALENFNFLHHILELCYYFLPFHTPMPYIFNMLNFLLNSANSIRYPIDKKILLLQLFADLGLYPEDDILIQLAINQTFSDTSRLTLDMLQLKALDEWIAQCIMSHPYSNQFKTIPLNYDNE